MSIRESCYNDRVKEDGVIYINIAEFVIKIIFGPDTFSIARNNIKKEIFFYCRNFLIKKNPRKVDFSIYLHQKDVWIIGGKTNKNFILLYEEIGKKRINCFYHINIFQFELILKVVLNKLLPLQQGFILHASSVKLHNKAILFLGKEGAGKSTAALLLQPAFTVLADDSVVIKKKNDTYYFYQTPFYEKNMQRPKIQESYELGKVFFLKKAAVFIIEQFHNKEYVFKKLMMQIYPEKKHFNLRINAIMNFADHFHGFCKLSFAKDSSRFIDLIKSSF